MPVFKSINLICLVMLYLRSLSPYFLHMALVTVTWICFMSPAITSSLNQNLVTGMRIGAVKIDGSPGLRLVVETRSPLQAQLSLLTDPYRLVIDMPGVRWHVDGLSQRGDLGKGLARVYRFGSPKPDTGRLVIELDQSARLYVLLLCLQHQAVKGLLSILSTLVILHSWLRRRH